MPAISNLPAEQDINVTNAEINATTAFNDPAAFSGTIQSIAKCGITKVTHTPATTSGAIFAAGFDEVEIDTTTAGMSGISHSIVRYKFLNILGNNNTTYQFIDETKLKVTGTGTHSNISFYKPAIDAINGTVTNMILFDGDMDFSGISGTVTNKYLLKCSYSDLLIDTAGSVKIGKDVDFDATVTATVGNVTINKSAGRVIMAAGASTVVVTNNLVTANSIIQLTGYGNLDATAFIFNYSATSGSFTITANANATANKAINFTLVN